MPQIDTAPPDVSRFGGTSKGDPMPDRVTANLPARDLASTAAFYARLGFEVAFQDKGWMILRRGPLEIEFFPHPDLDPATSAAGACVRVAELDLLHSHWQGAGLPAQGIPRLTAPRDEPFGFRMFALVDEDGNLLRCLSPLGG
jgi:catechol 2,3-dioxygenase-like lactoylglutathione lyase family enzyme